MVSLDRAMQLDFFFLHRGFFCSCLTFVFSPALLLFPWPPEFIISPNLPSSPTGADAVLQFQKWEGVKRLCTVSIQRLLAKTLTLVMFSKLRGHFDLFNGSSNMPTKVN